MEIRKSDLLKKEVRERYLAGKQINYKDINDRYGIAPDIVKHIVATEIQAVIQEKKDAERINEEVGELLDTDGNIKSKETLAFLHDHSKKLIESAIQNGDYGIALQAMNTLSKQVELSMKKLGELNKKDSERDIIPNDFIDFLLQNMEKYDDKKENTNKQGSDNIEILEDDSGNEL